MKNILKKAENAEKLLNLTSDTMILLDRNGVCVDIAVRAVTDRYEDIKPSNGRTFQKGGGSGIV